MILLISLLIGFTDNEPKATNDDYINIINKHKKVVETIFDKESWEKIDIIDKKTNKPAKFINLSNIEQKTFIIVFSQQISGEIAKLQTAWENELDLYKNPKYKSSNPQVSKPEEIEKFVKQIYESRKKFAEKFEEFVEKFVEEFEKEIIPSEGKSMIKKVKSFHDSFNLIPRKKE
jgi:hypothetical protein